MKREVIVATIALLTFLVATAWGLIHYYYKVKELTRLATQRHRAAAMDEKRAARAWDKARENNKQAENFYAESYKLRQEANSLVEQAISLIKEAI